MTNPIVELCARKCDEEKVSGESAIENADDEIYNRAIRDCIDALHSIPPDEIDAETKGEAVMEWTDEDKPIPEDAEINAHHPVVNKSHKTYEEALRLVGAKRSKGALVELVNWLLQRTAPVAPVVPELTDAEIIKLWGGPTSESNHKRIILFARVILSRAQ